MRDKDEGQGSRPRFSTRIPADVTPNRLAHSLARLHAEGRPILDLTASNPTCAGFDYPPDLLAPLADPRCFTYAPQPFGSMDARGAVAADYARRGVRVPPERIVLTASTSEAYSLLFKLLTGPGRRNPGAAPRLSLARAPDRGSIWSWRAPTTSSTTAPGRSISPPSSGRSHRARARFSSSRQITRPGRG